MSAAQNTHDARAAIVLALLVGLAGCSRLETPKVTPLVVRLRVSADAATLPLMNALTAAYATQHPNVIFTVQPGNAQTCADAIYNRQADIALVSLLPARVQGREPPWVADLAMDAVVVVVNPANPLASLSMSELRNIYAGVNNRWSDLGVVGLDDIEAAVREEGDGTRAMFDSAVMGNTRLTLSAIVLPAVDVMLNFVAIQPNTIGYVPSARITSTVTPAVKVLAIDGQMPTQSAIGSSAYPLTRILNLIALGEPQGELRQFVAWMLGAQGQAVVKLMNYAPINGAQP